MRTLATIRREAGYKTQAELGKALGINRTQIAKWENGSRSPRLLLIPQLAEALKITERELIAAVSASKPAHNG